MMPLNRNCLLLLLSACLMGQLHARDEDSTLILGERVYTTSCATGYCHTPGGGAGGGAARLAARGFDLDYITRTVSYGLHETSMQGFAAVLPEQELQAVIVYVASLNGIRTDGAAIAVTTTAGAGPELSPEAANGKFLLHESLRGFGRCATCHQVEGSGVPVADPITAVPDSARALQRLPANKLVTVRIGKESMPALVLKQGAERTIFYDLTSVPPVRRNVASAVVEISAGSRWRHASVLGTYTNQELGDILEYLHAVIE